MQVRDRSFPTTITGRTSNDLCVFQVEMARVTVFLLILGFGLVLIESDPAVDHSIIHENVLFYKDGEMSLSSSRWILTLVLDIGVYKNFIGKLTADLKMAKNLTVWMSKHYSSDKLAGSFSLFKMRSSC